MHGSVHQERRGAQGAARARPVALALGVLLAAEVAVYTAAATPGVRGDERFHTVLDGWLQGAAYVTAALLAALRPLVHARHRAVWWCVAAALAARAAGFVVHLAVVRWQTPVPYPSAADAGWLLTPPLLVAALALLARVPRREVRLRVALDGLVAGVACAGVALALLYPTLQDLSAPGLPDDVVAVNLAYPVADVVLLAVILAVAATRGWRPPRELAAVAAGVVGFAVSDAWFLAAVTAGTFHPGHPLGALALVATAAIAAAAWLPAGPPRRAPDADGTPGATAPALAALVCLGLLLHHTRGTTPPAVEALAETGLALVLVRTMLALVELQRLTAAQRLQGETLRRSRERAAEQAARLGAVLDGIPEHGIIGLRDGRISFFSPGAERLLGHLAAEVVGRRGLGDLVLAAELEARAAELGLDPGDPAVLVAGVRPGAGADVRRWTLVRRDGTEVPVELTLTQLPGGEHLGVARDVTREQLLQRYRATRDALGPLLEGAGAPEATLTAALRTVGTGMDWDICALWLPEPEEDVLRVRALWQAPAIASETWADGLRALRMAPGAGLTGRAWVEGTSAWFDDVGALQDLTAAEGAVRDGIPPRARTTAIVPVHGLGRRDRALGVLALIGRPRPRDPELVELLEIIASTLGRHVEREQSARELRRARDEAERANAAKSEVVSHISHELRTPLNAILGFAQLLNDDVADPAARERVRQILVAGQHLTEVVDDLLDVAQVEQGQVPMTLRTVSATDVVREVLDLTRPLVVQRGLDLEVDVHGGLFRHVTADFQRLRQILLNLISNAVKYNREGGRISVRVEDGPDPATLRFLVQDSGPGIPPDRIAALFRPFERLGAGDGAEQGTGLGLYVSRGLAEAMGGRLGVESTPGAGSTFFVDLPLAATPAAPAPVLPPSGPAGDEAGPGDAPGRLPAATVLLVEDNPANVRLVEHILAREPAVRLLVAETGQAGLGLARRHRPALVLLDLQLPDLDGAEVLRQLRADPQTRSTPVIVLSAGADEARSRALTDAGASAYLTKPLDVPAFLDAVAAVLPAAHVASAPGVRR